MSIKQIRQDIENWLTKRCRIDIWDLDAPSVSETIINGVKYPPNSAFYTPIQDLNYNTTSTKPWVTAVFKYYVVYRFDKSLSKYQLPLVDIEGLQEYLISNAVVYPNSVSTLVKKVSVVREENPVIVSKEETGNKDWLIGMVIPLMLEFLASPDPDNGGLQPSPDPENPWVAKHWFIDIYKREQNTRQDDLDRRIEYNGVS